MEKKSIVSYFKVFGRKCYILNLKKYLDNFDKKSNEEIFLRYFESKKEYRVYNKKTLVVEEAIHVTFDEANDVISKETGKEDNTEIQKELLKLKVYKEEKPDQMDAEKTDFKPENTKKASNLPKE